MDAGCPRLLGTGGQADKHQRSAGTPALVPGHIEKGGDAALDVAKQAEKRASPVLPSHLEVVQKLGAGAYGEVYLCNNQQDGSQVAIKWIKDFARDPVFGKRILREIRILASLNHPNLLSLTDLLPVPGPDFEDVYIVTPSMNIDLHKAIYSKMKLSESHAQAFACQILRGLKYLHSAGIVHRDLKPSNILLNRDCTLRIADLGLARGRMCDEEDLTDYVVTRWWRAPELMLFPSGYFEAIDIWSVGCIHAEILARKPIFPGDNHIDMLRRIVAVLGFQRERDLAWLPPEGEARESALKLTNALQLPEKPTKPLEAFVPAASLEHEPPQMTETPREFWLAIGIICVLIFLIKTELGCVAPWWFMCCAVHGGKNWCPLVPSWCPKKAETLLPHH